MSPPEDHDPTQQAMNRLNEELLDEDSPLYLGLIDPSAEGHAEVESEHVSVSNVGAALMSIMFKLISLDRSIGDRMSARAPLVTLVKAGGPLAEHARRELGQCDDQQTGTNRGGHPNVLPQLSPDAPVEHQRGQRQRASARYQAVAETHQVLTDAGLDGDVLWRAIRRFMWTASPNSVQSIRALRQTFRRRGEAALERSEAIPSKLEVELNEETGQTWTASDSESEEVRTE